jgi:hypothetical protein
MSTIKTDNITANTLPLPVMEGARVRQTFVATAAQTQYTISSSNFDWNSSIRAFIGMAETTCFWVSQYVVQIGGFVVEGDKVHIYKVGVDTSRVNGRGLINAVNDSAANTAGVAVGGLYRNGSVVMVRVS